MGEAPVARDRGHIKASTYLFFTGMDYEQQGGMYDLWTIAETEEELIALAKEHCPPPPNHWVHFVEIRGKRWWDIDDELLLEGKVVRTDCHGYP